MFGLFKTEIDKFKIKKYDEREAELENNRTMLQKNPDDFVKIEFECKQENVMKVLEILKLLDIKVF